MSCASSWPLHAVGALTDAERTELEDVLAARPDLQAELEDLQEVAAPLADAVPRDAAAVDARRCPRRHRRHPAAAPRDASAPAGPRDRRTRPSRPWCRSAPGAGAGRFVAIGAAAAAVVALARRVLVVLAVERRRDRPGCRGRRCRRCRRDPDAGHGEPGSLPGLTIVYSADARTPPSCSPTRSPVPDGDRVYELWAIRDGTPERFATFRPDESGRLSVYAPGLDPASAEVWAITEEPAGGSDTPTLPILNATA